MAGVSRNATSAHVGQHAHCGFVAGAPWRRRIAARFHPGEGGTDSTSQRPRGLLQPGVARRSGEQARVDIRARGAALDARRRERPLPDELAEGMANDPPSQPHRSSCSKASWLARRGHSRSGFPVSVRRGLQPWRRRDRRRRGRLWRRRLRLRRGDRGRRWGQLAVRFRRVGERREQPPQAFGDANAVLVQGGISRHRLGQSQAVVAIEPHLHLAAADAHDGHAVFR